MCEFSAIDRQHEDEVVDGKQVLGGLQKLDGIRRAASVQFINHHDQRSVSLDLDNVSAMSCRTPLNALSDFCAAWYPDSLFLAKMRGFEPLLGSECLLLRIERGPD